MNDNKGCGGIMRISPIPLYGLSQNRISDVEALNELAADSAELTHEHPLGYIPAYMMSHIIYRLGTDVSLTREEFHKYVLEAMQMADEETPEHEAIRQIGEGWVAEETLAMYN